MQTVSVKQQTYRMVETLPDSATWEDLMRRIYVRQAIQAGLKGSEEGRTIDVKEVRHTLAVGFWLREKIHLSIDMRYIPWYIPWQRSIVRWRFT